MRRNEKIRELYVTTSLLGFLWIGVLIVTVVSAFTSMQSSIPMAILLVLIAISEVLLMCYLPRRENTNLVVLVLLASHSSASVAYSLVLISNVRITVYMFCLSLFWILTVISYLILCYALRHILPLMSMRVTILGVLLVAVGLIGISVGVSFLAALFLLGLLTLGLGMTSIIIRIPR